MAETPDKLSSEDIQKLSRAINDAKELIKQQEKMLRQTLALETEIIERRNAGLIEYSDTYSKLLNNISSEQSYMRSELEQINKANKEAAAAAEKTTKANKSKNKKASETPISAGSTLTDEEKEPEEKADRTRAKDQKFADKLAKFFEHNQEIRKIITETQDIEEAAILNTTELENAVNDKRQKQYENNLKLVKQNNDTMMALELARYQTEEDRELALTELRLSRFKQVSDAELATQDIINSLDTQIAYGSDDRFAAEAGELRAREIDTVGQAEQAKKLAEDIAAFKAKRELELARKNGGILKKEDFAQIEKEAAAKLKTGKENIKKLAEEERKAKANKAMEEDIKKSLSTLTDKNASFAEKKQALFDMTHDSEGNWDKQKAGAATVKAIEAGIDALSSLAQQLEQDIDKIAQNKGPIDTRLYGSKNEKFLGSYWDQMVRDMTKVGAINPFFKQEIFAENIKTLVSKGIAFNVEQRAFLMTIKDKIATTFNVADASLLKLIRIQQEDSTAGRLGMEASLNAFLNEMYATTEYLESVASSVRTSLYEMEALMEGADAAEVEYQVQKWMGSLYSVGMSDNAVNAISTALGQIAAGQIEGLTNGGAGNLLIMAANDAGVPIADILTNGINSKDTNKLLQAAVNYLAELADSSKDNKVVQQQLAGVFGVKASDLKAATNLVVKGTTGDIYGKNMTYENMLNTLYTMAGSMYQRTSIAEMMANIWENGKYTIAGSMASNPVSYMIYKMAKLLDDAAGGIALPFVNVMGYGIDLNTTVSDLMRVAAVGTGILGSLGPMITGLGNSFSGRAMLEQLGISAGSGLAVTPRGGGGGPVQLNSGGGSQTTSGSGYVGNASGSDIKDSTIQESEDSKKQQMIEAKEEEETNKVDILNQTVIQIYELLNDVASGKSSFNVKVEGYGLTSSGSSGSSRAMGGVQALSGGTSTAGLNSENISGSANFSGWTTSL